MKTINYISNLDPALVSGGWGGINFRMCDQLKRFFSVHYIGPINPPALFSEKLISKLQRVLGAKGNFQFFSNARLNKISNMVKPQLKNEAAFDFYFGQTTWIGCKPAKPYAVYMDASFPTYMEVYSQPAKFKQSDLDRIAKQEAEWLKKASIVFYGSVWAKDLTLQQYKMPPDNKKHVVINTGGNMKIPQQDIYNREQHGINFLFISLNFEKKGGFECWEAFKLIKQHYPQATLSIIGQEPPANVKETDGVQYLGLLKKNIPEQYAQMEKAFATATFLIHPTKMDTMGAVILEAGYFGCPTIAPSLFGIPDLIKDGQTGFLLKPDFTPKEIAQRIHNILHDNSAYNAMRAACRKFTVNELSWDAIGNKMFESLASL